MSDERLQIALEVTGSAEKAKLLIQLIDMTVNKGSKFPDVKMLLPEDET